MLHLEGASAYICKKESGFYIISLGVRLENFNLSTIAGITTVDEMELSAIGEKKTTLFAVIPDKREMSFTHTILPITMLILGLVLCLIMAT